MFLASKMFDSILDGTIPQNFDLYRRWIEKFEQKLSSTDRNFTPAESQGRLAGTLEVRIIPVSMNI
jgi:hypothetical protein